MRPERPAFCAPRFRWLLAGLALFGLLAGPVRLAAAEILTRDLDYPDVRIAFDESGRWVEISFPGGSPDVSLGEPDIPSNEVLLPLPAGMHAEGVSAEVLEETRQTLARPVLPYRGGPSFDLPDPPESAPDPAVYQAEAAFPAHTARLVTEFEMSTGRRFAVVRVYPIHYLPATGEALWAKRIRLSLELASKPGAFSGLPMKRAMQSALPAETAGPWQRVLIDEPGFLPREAPSVQGAPVEYVILVPPDDALESAWQRLAAWKTNAGHPALVVRTDWIDEHYPTGADPAERIRLFLQDAHQNWNLKWVLIGADVDGIPVRYAYSRMLGTGLGTAIATDYYYACLERSWDADRNGYFGQAAGSGISPGDSTDTTPDIQVGRVSARTVSDVNAYLDKYFRYVQDPPRDGYLDKILYLGEVLFDVDWSLHGRDGGPDCHAEECNQENSCRQKGDQLICARLDGADDCLLIYDILNGTMGITNETKLLFERMEYQSSRRPELSTLMELETGASALAHLSLGYGMALHVGHGYHDRWAVGDGRILNGDLARLTNGDQGHLYPTYAVNCHSAAIDYDSFGEKILLMPQDGVVTYMGCTNADFPGAARPFTRDFIQTIYGEPGATIGDGFFASLAASALTGTQINLDTQARFMLYTQTLLGEPGMPFWPRTPDLITASLPDYSNFQVPIGVDRLRVSINPSGDPVDGASVCVHKNGESYAVGALGGGAREIIVPFHPRSTGEFSLVVTAPNCVPVRLTGTVVAPSATRALYLSAFAALDDGTASSRGNGNGQAEPGERLRVSLTLGNQGTQAAGSVDARLRLSSRAPAGCATIPDSTASFASIAAGGTAGDANAFLISFPSEMDAIFGSSDRIEIPFVLVLDPGGTASRVEVTLQVARPRLRLAVNKLTGSAGTQRLWVGVENHGEGTASHLLGRLRSRDTSAIIVIGQGVRAQHDIAPGDTALVGPFSLDIRDALGRLDFALVDTFQTPDDTLYARDLDLDGPAPPVSPMLMGELEAMRITWSLPSQAGDGIYGFKVYRMPPEGGPYEDVTPGVLSEHRFFEDVGLESLEQYTYQIAAVDRGGNIGVRSTPISAYTTPGIVSGWPNFVDVAQKSSPLICELDGWTGTGREVVISAETIYAYHGNGSEVADGDGAELTSGPFAGEAQGYLMDEFWARASAGDIDDDGDVEVLAIAFNHTNQSPSEDYPDPHGELFCWGPRGTLEWVYVFERGGICWSTPTLADLDNDGQMEVIFVGGKDNFAGIYVLDCHGQPWMHTNSKGLLRDLHGSNLFQSPAIGDIDGDNLPDIVLATRHANAQLGALWALNRDGTSLPGFNPLNDQGLLFSSLGQATHTTGSPTLCDVDGVAGDEIFIITETRLWCVRKSGRLVWSYTFPVNFSVRYYELLPEPALGDLDRDGDVEAVLVDAAGKVLVFDGETGSLQSPFPITLNSTIKYGSCILANIDEDPRPEIIFGDEKGYVHAYRYDGQLARGFPLYYGGNFVRQSLAAWDLDLDGHQNLVAQATDMQKLVIFDMANSPFPADETERAAQNPWPMRFRDAYATGRLSPVPPVAVHLVLEAPVPGEGGEVTLTWETAEEAIAFRVLRRAASEETAVVVGEVPADGRPGTHRYSYLDRPPVSGSYVYRIVVVRPNGLEEPGAEREVTVSGPHIAFGIDRLWPDPLPPGRSVRIACGLPGSAGVEVDAALHVFDVQGRRVLTLFSGPHAPGVQTVDWDGRDAEGRALPAGVYLLRLEMGPLVDSKRMLVIR
ncbi:MAG: hypothetical protein KA123_02605 [Candidatus Eisenbacteria bacterium]|nr:hypothetical protein [Candidatus Eisenbacteria bacterium]